MLVGAFKLAAAWIGEFQVQDIAHASQWHEKSGKGQASDLEEKPEQDQAFWQPGPLISGNMGRQIKYPSLSLLLTASHAVEPACPPPDKIPS